ncbi:hypothetical protein DPMN_061379 [Dreissena polymorpha]|uniref:Uncharacterized protein n=1 Tax=Dreissena polymorpha TaxID=45954 RepID=A0A9D4C7R4_DREPO|nr:hypothetical protein DPMN_061379 [Dreissena polymorpha]
MYSKYLIRTNLANTKNTPNQKHTTRAESAHVEGGKRVDSEVLVLLFPQAEARDGDGPSVGSLSGWGRKLKQDERESDE